MVKGFLGIIPVALYILLESIFVGIIVLLIWAIGFKDIIPMYINGEHITYLHIVGLIWGIKLTLNNVLGLSFATTYSMEENSNDKINNEINNEV